MLRTHSQVVSVRDFEDPELRAIIGDMYRHTWPEHSSTPVEDIPIVLDTRRWENALAVDALTRFGNIDESAVVLGVGAGIEVTSFYLAKIARLVMASDLYLDSKEWADVAPRTMLSSPADFSPFPIDPHRLLGVHVDATNMSLPSEFFDGVFSSSSIEHFLGFDRVEAAAAEIGRVLKPGGVASISTKLRIDGPSQVISWGHDTVLFSESDIRKRIVEPSGCELVGDLDLEIDDETVATDKQLVALLGDLGKEASLDARLRRFPNLVVTHEGFVFCSVNLVLRKPTS